MIKSAPDLPAVDPIVTHGKGRFERSFWLAALTLLPYVLLLLTTFSVFAQTVDDPFITLRYARNLLAGLGPVFNPGEHVEGFTSPLHLLLMALLLKIAPSVGALFKAKVLSLLFAFVLLRQVRSLASAFGLSPGQGVLAQCLIALNINFAIPAVNGLETTLYAVLLGAAVYFFLIESQAEAGGLWPRSALWLFAALLARPDTLLSFGALLCVHFWRLYRGETTLRSVIAWAAVFLVPLAALTLARLWYFGEPLPNTYYAKHVALGWGIQHGFSYFMRPLTPIGTETHVLPRRHGTLDSYLLLPQMVWYWGLFGLGLTRLKALKSSPVLVAEIAAMALFVLRAGGDWMLGWRFILPFSPYVTFVQCLGLVVAGNFLARLFPALRPHRRGPAFAVGATALFWLASAGAAPHFSWSASRFSTNDRALLAPAMYGRVWVAASDYIHAHVPSGATVAGSEMGYGPYINMDKRFFDVRGLTNEDVTHAPSDLKDYTGVHDRHWYRTDSFVGSRILAQSPALIYIVLDNTDRPLIFGGRYRRTLISADMQARVKACKTAVNFYVPTALPRRH